MILLQMAIAPILKYSISICTNLTNTIFSNFILYYRSLSEDTNRVLKTRVKNGLSAILHDQVTHLPVHQHCPNDLHTFLTESHTNMVTCWTTPTNHQHIHSLSIHGLRCFNYFWWLVEVREA